MQAALALVAAEGFDALTMRRVASALETGPASLYAHVRDKAELDDLLIGELCARVELPTPSPDAWMMQFKATCAQLRDLYLAYPGISQATFSDAPRNLHALRINEGLLAILLAGGVAAQPAAWAIDAAILYVGAYSLERSLRQADSQGSMASPATGTGSPRGYGCCPQVISRTRSPTCGKSSPEMDANASTSPWTCCCADWL